MSKKDKTASIERIPRSIEDGLVWGGTTTNLTIQPEHFDQFVGQGGGIQLVDRDGNDRIFVRPSTSVPIKVTGETESGDAYVNGEKVGVRTQGHYAQQSADRQEYIYTLQKALARRRRANRSMSRRGQAQADRIKVLEATQSVLRERVTELTEELEEKARAVANIRKALGLRHDK